MREKKKLDGAVRAASEREAIVCEADRDRYRLEVGGFKEALEFDLQPSEVSLGRGPGIRG